MINKNLNSSLKLNKLDFVPPNSNFGGSSSPFTPVDQTLKTPLEAPQHQTEFPLQHQFQSQQQGYHGNVNQSSLYQNPEVNESDDILTDIDEPCNLTRRNFTLFFTNQFDQVLISIYSTILSLPTTTPFSGNIPPSGLVSKVANETIKELIRVTSASKNTPIYDQFNIINSDCLRSHEYQPIILQLIRKRLLEICHSKNNSVNKLPESTSISLNSTVTRNSSVSNLSLSDMNLMNYNNSNQNNTAVNLARSRSSSINLRKQSLTRNNSNNWLHVGNINNLRPSGNPDFNMSTDSLQSFQDFVPQSIINRTSNGSGNANVTNNSNNLVSSSSNVGQLNSMMMDYHITPPTSHKGSISSTNSPYNIVHNPCTSDSEEFQFLQRSRSSSRGNNLPQALNINTDMSNLQALNSLQGNSGNSKYVQPGLSLDSPFLSATTPGDEYFSGPSFANPSNNSTTAVISAGSNSVENAEAGGDTSKANLPNQYSLSEKKRDSLKMKRGIH
ncbi:hypothetical protein MGC_05678 [Candida albicans P37039]|nr:hypothetical protein MGC_05678 [Candida albicans P37039]